jgi:hypothetical protein
LKLCEIITYLSIWILFEKNGKKITHPHSQIEKEDGIGFWVLNVYVT